MSKLRIRNLLLNDTEESFSYDDEFQENTEVTVGLFASTLYEWIDTVPTDKDGKFIGPQAELAEYTQELLREYYE